MKVAALAGGIGAGKFLRGLIRVVPPDDLAVIVNTGDDLTVHGLHVSPDVDSVTYWLSGLADRERGWGRKGETFRATEELQVLEADGAWFGLGDLDLATHLFRTPRLRAGETLSGVTDELRRRWGVGCRILPMSDDAVTTMVEAVDDRGHVLDLHFQEYWVLRGARDEVKAIRFDGAARASPAPGVLDALREADLVVMCPSNPVVSIDPILAVPGIRGAVTERRDRAVAVSPIVAGAPLRGMADQLLPVVGVPVTASGVAEHYAGLIGAFVVDEVDRELASEIESLGLRVAVTDTIMVDDDAAEALARVTVAIGGATT
ncbi:MAG TPA: 2-phospho-L-lactate transferase [Actinomycetota bacterium]|nr:2-phospho-L-lactate transferase [Actinomycetota bacterium]